MFPQVLVTSAIAEDSIRQLQQIAQVEIIDQPEGPSREEIILGLQGKAALLCNVTDTIDEQLLQACPDLRIISNFGVGHNHIDIDAATRQGILVTNTPGVLTEATADLTWSLLLDLARRVTEGDRLIRQHRWRGWSPQFMLGTEVTGKTLGIIGMGRIGQAVARRAHGFRMKILYYSRTRLPLELEKECNLEYRDLSDLLSEADFVSLHAPYTQDTHHLIGERQLMRMKKSSFLINTARGALVDEEALVRALKNGQIAGAALDVYEQEPHVPEELIQLEQVVLAPHLGSATRETRAAMAQLAVENLIAFFQGEKPRYLVNEQVWQDKLTDM